MILIKSAISSMPIVHTMYTAYVFGAKLIDFGLTRKNKTAVHSKHNTELPDVSLRSCFRHQYTF